LLNTALQQKITYKLSYVADWCIGYKKALLDCRGTGGYNLLYNQGLVAFGKKHRLESGGLDAYSKALVFSSTSLVYVK
jgi:hypothetical protein